MKKKITNQSCIRIQGILEAEKEDQANRVAKSNIDRETRRDEKNKFICN